MRQLVLVATAAVGLITLSNQAWAQSNDPILQRIDALEKRSAELDQVKKENDALRERVRRLESSRQDAVKPMAPAHNVVATTSPRNTATSSGQGYAANLGAVPVYKTAPYLAAPFNWTSIYVGVVGGAALFESTFSDTECTFNCAGPNQAKLSGTVGLTAGANWQFGHAVIGIEGDANWANFKNQQIAVPIGSTILNQSEWKNFSTVRARAGLAADNVLIYATGGVAIAKAHYFAGYTQGGGLIRVGAESTKVGLAGGGGAEFGIANNLSARLEYLFIAIPSTEADLIGGGCTGPGQCPVSWRSNAHLVRAGLDYRFNWFQPSPVVARY